MDMMSEMGNMFKKVEEGNCRLTMNGGIAVATKEDGTIKYKTYDVSTGRLTNVTNFCLPVAQDFFFAIPTNKVKKGDIIIVNGSPKCVISENKADGTIKVMDYTSSEMKEIVPERHIFLGNTYFYTKIYSIFGKNFTNGKKGTNNMLKMMMMSSMMGGETPAATNNGMMGNMMQMMMMQSMLGGGSDMSDMFDFDGMFDDGSDDSTDTDTEGAN